MNCIIQHTHPALLKISFLLQSFTIRMYYFIPKCSTITTATDLFYSKRSSWSPCQVSFQHACSQTSDSEWDMCDNLFQCFILKQLVQNHVRNLWPRQKQMRALLYSNIYRSHKSDLFLLKNPSSLLEEMCQGNLQSPAMVIMPSAILLCTVPPVQQKDRDSWKEPCHIMKECLGYRCKRTEVRWVGWS